MRRLLQAAAVVVSTAAIGVVGGPGLRVPGAGAALLPNGSAAWGQNSSGQLGNGTTIDRSSPTVVSGITGIEQIAAGDGFALALLNNGTVMAWGDNTHGQLGNGTTTASSVPVAVTGLTQVKWVAAGGSHSLAVLKNGTVMAWGDNTHGELGDGTTTDSDVPVLVVGGPGMTPLTGVRQVQAGEDYSIAVVPYGSVKAWGGNASGQLGDGTTTDSSYPVAVTGLVNNVRSIAAGSDFALAIMGNESVQSWGDNAHGQLGNGTTTPSDVPTPVPGLSFVHVVAAGGAHALAILPGGQVDAWGENSSGQLGIGSTTDSDVPVTVSGLSGVQAVDAGGLHSLALLRTGTVDAWGDNTYGQLGDGTTTQRDSPVAVPDITGVSGIRAGGNFSFDKQKNLAPYFTGRKVVAGRVGRALSFTFHVHSHPTLAVISETGPLPSGLTLTDNHDNTATLGGTPATGTAGRYTVQLLATNGIGATGTLTLRIIVRS